MDLLSPHLLRQRARSGQRSLGLGGERLSAFLYELDASLQQVLLHKLRHYYPNLAHYKTQSLQSGWKQLSIQERLNGSHEVVATEARHINDGMLRIMAIIAQTLTKNPVLLFDEIENGINPELIERLMDDLITAPQQIIVTTHSPMVLNYLDDATACDGVHLVYRNPRGHTTSSTPFFSIPAMREKLSALGPGEVFIDTDLTHLVQSLP
jgi:predicted ATPase